MATHDIFMPALSSTMTEGKIVEWLKNPGDKVERGESVLVVESDKADMDVESFHDGFLASIVMPAGSSAPVGETIGLIVETADEIAEAQANTPSAPPQVASQEKESSSPQSKEKQVSIDSSKTVVRQTPTVQETSLNHPQFLNDGRVVASPRAKKLASQMGVDLATVRGSGPHGRIQAEDVLSAKGQPISVPWIAESNAPAQVVSDTPRIEKKTVDSDKPPAPGKSFGSMGETIAFNTLQQAVNRNMEQSLNTPCFRVGYSILTDELDSFYKQVKPNGVTMTALLAKAVGLTLARHPQVNAAFSSEGIAYPSQINVAVAVAMEDGGLITPVLQNAEETSLADLSLQWADLVKRARNKQLEPHEYSSGTFTLSNLGMFGVDRFDAILPPGTGAILAVGASLPKVVASKDGSISIKKQMQVNLTADHRVIYGADGALFLKDLAYLIEKNPYSLSS
ncbi:dihydrolipoamide acetyltransferase family protein [Prochlorococcus marinus]|uniref:Dihydrolipoamide acetyltransferase component of pyruvate dehydrogenase complex n=1 Tax=Prochlorococcus marinus XMU1408 TaxID=2213228 RepID=A0A318RF41_PROMR|nr:dihydrolipoamide acetyltransferase family protein [Prochlorococcus marinus]MBW3041421.1 branched-chain alpha-keto acid dehydrogenase subunit E2 [Prochlorococcus marinus str. XMU1408]PYE02583.1 branched-chain alpha-keto acid dehydrogenase subunit E2 [Prochlorococcus marinus XMU1408]